RTPFDLSRQVAEAVEQLLPQFEAKRQSIQLNMPEEATAFGNADRIKQALFNLLGNAIKYTPSGGRIEVKVTESEASRHPEATAAAADKLILVRVTDTGL
ncbi:ATP-binding protein, partial [Arthrospira platensis SPKY2]